MTLLASILLLQLCIAASFANLVNQNVKTVIDISSPITITKTTITMKNTGSEPQSTFQVLFPPKLSPHLTDIWLTKKSTSSKQLYAALETSETSRFSHVCAACKALDVRFPSPLQPAEKITIELRTDITHVLHPVPHTLEGFTSQYMRFGGTAYFYSPYQTESMRTVLILGSSDIKSRSGFIQPVTESGKRIEMGPYTDIPPFSTSDISVRFKNDRGFLVADLMEKSFYVSHWGSISVKEEYRLRNAAARHQGEWSRVDHSNGYRSRYATALGDTWANLPADANHVEYKDLVGNVTSSRLQSASKGKRALQLTFRYPMMGGWNNHFWITYQLSHDKYITSNVSDHLVQLPLFPSLNMDLYCEKLVVKIYLPDGAGGESILEHPSLRFDVDRSTEWTTLSVLGRPTLTLNLNRIRSQSKHSPTLKVVYRFNTVLTWVTPLFVGGFVLALLAVCMAFVWSGVLTEDQGNEFKSKKLQ
ncbi:unnamed protein product [Agarophyton chilense]